MPPETCPNCGADVPRGARSCPECGSDEKTGWSEEAATGGLGLPEEKFDYDDYVRREFGRETKPRGIRWFWWAVAVVLLVLLLFLFLR
ncbi:MAG TPA: zinc ribbon domain-containing protein [Verrucomicrobiae bacterium]|nr:zinc ribbon domain-containing protein [Verrucomicrobiae bacterium]